MIFFDLETTGLDILKDRIIELYALKVENGNTSEIHFIFNPEIPIPIEVSNINGFTDEMVKDKPQLFEHIKEIFEFFKGQELIGYNILNFDLLILSEEFRRCGYELDLNENKILDLLLLWRKYEPKNLRGALKRFCNSEIEDLHSAKNDVHAAVKVYNEMIKSFGLERFSLSDLALLSNPNKDTLCYGKLLKNKDGELVLNFGKYTGHTIREVYKNDIEYLRWIYTDYNDTLIKYFVTKEALRIKAENLKTN